MQRQLYYWEILVNTLNLFCLLQNSINFLQIYTESSHKPHKEEVFLSLRVFFFLVFWDLLLAFWQYYALRLNLINVIFNWRLLIFNGETWILSLLHMCVETLNFSYVYFGFAHSKCQILNSLINISWNCFKFFNMRNLKLIFQRHRNGDLKMETRYSKI